ncbi:uncharacterized protein C7orf57 homolog isoform X2 [Thalassophryne amazonica]|uniref:uncharacterized protein C7orf57 homolog isoform X2 n=1 Tax=Thalassophryne amazonica TaxID=390379 RepID=UPI001470966C|nr:uncharacterized protein C7orf57 homolog isoform X2 [Thalassophryne amazonica]
MHSETSTVHMNDKLQPAKSGSPRMNTQISQIPGLSPSVISGPEEKVRGRRHGVRKDDTDYIKLAKQGGHKGLLWHVEKTEDSKANCYKPPEWFCSSPLDSSKPSLINSDEQKVPGGFQQPECPAGTVSKSTEEMVDRDSDDNETDSVCENGTKKKSSSTQNRENIKFRRKVFDKKASPVNMSKLLSFGYAESNKPTNNKEV